MRTLVGDYFNIGIISTRRFYCTNKFGGLRAKLGFKWRTFFIEIVRICNSNFNNLEYC